MLAKLYWRRFRCADCHRPFTLPLDDFTLPAHTRGRGASEPCLSDSPVPHGRLARLNQWRLSRIHP